MELGEHISCEKVAAYFRQGFRHCNPAGRWLRMEAGLGLHGGAQPLQLRGGQGAVSHSGDHLPQGLDTYVPGGIQAVRRGLLAAVGEDIALLVQLRQPLHQLRGRLISGKDEDAESLSVRRVVLGHLAGLCVAIADEPQGGVTGHLLHHCVGEDCDLLMVPGGVRRGLGAGEAIAPDQDGHMAGVLGKKHALLSGREAAAHHKDILAGKELPIAGGAIGNSPPPELCFTLEPHHTGMGAGGQQDAEALQIATPSAHSLHITAQIQFGDLRQEEFRTEGLGLFPHRFRERGAAGSLHPGEIDHFCGNGDLPAEVVLFHDHDPVAGPGQIEGGGESRRPSSDDHDIVEIFHPLHGLQLPHQIQAGLQGLGARLPLRRAHLVSMLRHELAGLHLPQKFIGIPAHIAGVDLISHDFPFGVHDEAAPLGHAIRLDIDLKIFGQTMGGVGQHGILDILDALGSVMPRLMDEMGIAGNRVDFAADGLEFLIEIGQILQFCGAHKGKIGRIEEEHAPLAQDVRLGDSSESVVLVALYGEIGNFFLNQGHG